MEAYVKGIILIGAVGTVILSALPHGEGGSGRYVKYIAGLTVLLVIISPITGLLDTSHSFSFEVPTVQKGESELYSAVISKTAENISRFISDRCLEKFSLDPESIRVRLLLDESDVESVEITEIQIYTEERKSEKRDRIRRYFGDLFETKVYVFGP